VLHGIRHTEITPKVKAAVAEWKMGVVSGAGCLQFAKVKTTEKTAKSLMMMRIL